MSLLQQQYKDRNNLVVDSKYENENSLWLKVFLIDSSLNQNLWKLSNDFIRKNIQNFVGKPFILTKNKAHPDFVKEGVVFGQGQKTVDQLLTAQSKYQIGQIKKVEEDSAKKNQWFAYIQITDPKIIQSFKEGNIPFYVSPSIFDPQAAPPGQETTNFTALHIAAVDEPAYGLKAYTHGSCMGSQDQCVNELKTASQQENEECPCSILKTFTNKFISSSSVEDSSFVKNASLDSNSLSTINNNNNLEIPTQVDTSSTKTPVDEVVTNPIKNEVESKQPEKIEAKKVEEETAEQNRKIATVTEKESTANKKTEEKIDLKEIKAQLEQLSEWKKAQEESAAKQAVESQKMLIENTVTLESVAGNEEKRKEVIDTFSGLNVSNEQLNKLLGLFASNSKGSNQVKQAATINKLVIKGDNTTQQQKRYFSRGFFD